MADDTPPFQEPHYTVKQLAEWWGLSAEFVRQLVAHEPGVTEWVRQAPGRRRYRVLRVPQSVAERVYRKAQRQAEATKVPKWPPPLRSSQKTG